MTIFKHHVMLYLLGLSLALYAFTPSSYANIPAAYLACEGALEGAECSLPGPQYGICVRDTLCEDITETTVDECVLCVDGCWAGKDGDECVRPWSGDPGICETQDLCTDPPETSFEECRRCVLPLDTKDTPSTEGCIQDRPSHVHSIVILIWFMMIYFVIKYTKWSAKN